MDNDMAITVVSRWRCEDVDRLSLAGIIAGLGAAAILMRMRR